jgi:hypothetical protein
VTRSLFIPLVIAGVMVVVVLAAANRYQYYAARVVGKTGAETDLRRVDTWTGARQVRVCYGVDTAQPAEVPPPPPQPPGGASSQTTSGLLTNSRYFIDLNKWRTDHPDVNPQTLRITKTTCAWERTG